MFCFRVCFFIYMFFQNMFFLEYVFLGICFFLEYVFFGMCFFWDVFLFGLYFVNQIRFGLLNIKFRLCQVRLGQVWLMLVRLGLGCVLVSWMKLGQVRFGLCLRLSQVRFRLYLRLGQVRFRLGQVRFGLCLRNRSSKMLLKLCSSNRSNSVWG